MQTCSQLFIINKTSVVWARLICHSLTCDISDQKTKHIDSLDHQPSNDKHPHQAV